MTKFLVGDLVTRHPDHLGGNWGIEYISNPRQVLRVSRIKGDGKYMAFDKPDDAWKSDRFILVNLENE